MVGGLEFKMVELLTQVPVEASNRHVHLSKEDCERLFGDGYELTPDGNLSQPGQFKAKEKVRISYGDKDIFDKEFAIIGPTRGETQIEIRRKDIRRLGFDDESEVPTRQSGEIEGTPGVRIYGPNGNFIDLNKGLIVPKRHVHIPRYLAEQEGIKDNEGVNMILTNGKMLDLVARVHDMYGLAVHIDCDEALSLDLPQFKPENAVKNTINIGGKNYDVSTKPSAYCSIVRVQK